MLGSRNSGTAETPPVGAGTAPPAAAPASLEMATPAIMASPEAPWISHFGQKLLML